MGYEGFSGNESILYHLHSPCRIADAGEFKPIVHEEWVPDAHVHRHLASGRSSPAATRSSGRRCLMWNADLEVSLCSPDDGDRGLLPRRRGRRGDLRPRGLGHARDGLRRARLPRARLRRDPARHHLPLPARRRPAALARASTRRARSRRRTATATATASCSSTRRTPSATSTRRPSSRPTARAASTSSSSACAAASSATCSTTTRSTSSAGTATSTRTRSTSTTSSRGPGASTCRRRSHQTFQGPNFVICSFCPRELDYDPQAVPIPYHHSNLQSEEVIYYVDGEFGCRKGVEVGSITVHPSGLPHGPQPGLVEKSLGDAAHRGARGDVGHVPAAAADRARARRSTTRRTRTRGATASRRRWRSPRRDREVGCSRRHSSTRR